MFHFLSYLTALSLLLSSTGAWGQQIASDPSARKGKAGPVIQVTGNDRNIAPGARTTVDSNNTHFGTHDLFGALVTRTFTIRNSGDDVLQLRNPETVQLQNTDSLTFKVEEQPSATRLGAGGSTAFSIRFDPDTAKRQTAIVEIRSNDSTRTPYTFLISGRGKRKNTGRTTSEKPSPLKVYQGRNDRVHVKLPETGAPNRTLILRNLQGQAVRQLTTGKGRRHITLSTNDLPRGLYIVTTQSSRQRFSQKLMLR